MPKSKTERTSAADLAKSGYIMPAGYDEADDRAEALAGQKKIPKTKEEQAAQEAAEKAAAGPAKSATGPSEIKVGSPPAENKAAKSKSGK